VIFGSGTLVHSLMRHKLIDQFVLQIHPIVLCKGRRLFSAVTSAMHTLIRNLVVQVRWVAHSESSDQSTKDQFPVKV
jgi:dihydrofolate reductase